MSYKHITSEERDKLSVLLQAGMDQEEIAMLLNKDPSSISREMRRNSDPCTGKYHAKIAKKKTAFRRFEAKQDQYKIQNNKKLKKFILVKLKRFWSPEQIAGRVNRRRKKTIVSKDTIYQYIYRVKPRLTKYLRFKKDKYRRRRGTKIREKQREEVKKRRINTRPKIVEKRKRVGDWEGDTIIGKGRTSAILTHVERKSGYLLADKVKNRTSREILDKVVERFENIPKSKKVTETYDNGVEFSSYEEIERETNITIYFAMPYHSWERGTNENTNGLLRQFFPKGMRFDTITQKEVDMAVSLLNNRPRKRLNYLTPKEVFFSCTSS